MELTQSHNIYLYITNIENKKAFKSHMCTKIELSLLQITLFILYDE